MAPSHGHHHGHHHSLPAHSFHHGGVETEPMDMYDHHSSGNNNSSTADATSNHLQLDAADHLMALLQREANDYSLPLPMCYYPNEFDDFDNDDNDDDEKDQQQRKKTGKAALIGPWRRRIASWMYDVVDHFKYDRNVVSIALRFIDQYVSHLLLRSNNKKSSSGSSGPVVKRRHFQLIAVTSLYLAIKVHGELHEEEDHNDEIITTLISEVDGYGMTGGGRGNNDDSNNTNHLHLLDNEEEDEEDEDDDIRALSSKIADLRRRHRSERLSRLTHTATDSSNSGTHQQQPLHPVPFKPRKRGMLSGPLRLSSFVELSRGLFISRDITDTETKILKALNYVVNPPTSRKFVGEMMRMLALCTSGGGSDMAALQVNATHVGLDRTEILQAILASACRQTEAASSIPSLSLGCLPSVVAYGALVNAIEDEFSKHGPQDQQRRYAHSLNEEEEMMMEAEEEKKIDSYQLEDFQRHYRRYARSQSAPIVSSPTIGNNINVNNTSEMEKEQYLDAWKEQFFLAVYHATNCFLAPDSDDILRVRELLQEEVDPESSADQEDVDIASSSPTDETNNRTSSDSSSTSPARSKKKSKHHPRSPRSVITGMTAARWRGSGSFFSRNNSSSSNVVGENPSASRASSMSRLSSFSSSTGHQHFNNKGYCRQVSEPIADTPHHSSHPHHARAMSCVATNTTHSFAARASTPDMSDWRNNGDVMTTATTGQDHWEAGNVANNSHDHWRSFQPPPFFSA